MTHRDPTKCQPQLEPHDLTQLARPAAGKLADAGQAEVTRRRFLGFLGAGAGAAALLPGSRVAWGTPAARNGLPIENITPLRLPMPLEIYTKSKSWLQTAIGKGKKLPASAKAELPAFTVVDSLVTAPEYESYVIAAFGDRVFPNGDDYVGYNHDYTGFVALGGNDAGMLWINHEYISFPFHGMAPNTRKVLAGERTTFKDRVGFNLPRTRDVELMGEFYYNTGGSALFIRKLGKAGYQVVKKDPRNFRLHGLSGLAINGERKDRFAKVTRWGSRAHQKGDANYLIGTGPAARDVFEGVNADGLGNRIIGTSDNCSGGTTPWGTILSAEENFQTNPVFFMGVTEGVTPAGSQLGYSKGSSGAAFGMVGEKYGWMVEIDPADRMTRARKHTALGRFRRENIGLRADRGSPVIAYMGDDRSGGHLYKFVSDGKVTDPASKANSRLFESGTLYAARFNADGTGTWIPLKLETATAPNVPSEIGAVEKKALGAIQWGGLVRLPRRKGLAGAVVDGGNLKCDAKNEASVIPYYKGKTLADFYTTQGAVLCDAFLACNLIGATPCGRPEDVEVHPKTNDIYVAFTDGIAGPDGYPDSRIFAVAKYDRGAKAVQPSGVLMRIRENAPDGAGTTFTWSNWLHSGEAGAANGAGFANVDNLSFDDHGNLWAVTDMSTSRQNGLETGRPPFSQRKIDHRDTGGTSFLVGVYGNNWMFTVATSGPFAGYVVPVAYGPMRAELTGPTHVGETLILSVQHPGEDVPIGKGKIQSRRIEMLGLSGALFTQTRTVPTGSNWPSNTFGQSRGIPYSATVGIHRR